MIGIEKWKTFAQAPVQVIHVYNIFILLLCFLRSPPIYTEMNATKI